MSLLELYDRSLIGRRDRAAIEYDRPGGGTASLTFGELDARSNQLAQLLLTARVREQVAGDERQVGLLGDGPGHGAPHGMRPE